MSDDNKRDRALQRRVRERQAKTGESYQAAWQQLAASEAPRARELAQGTNDAANNSQRIPLPLNSTAKVLPGQWAQISSGPCHEAFWPDRLLIKNADHWDVHRLAIGTGKVHGRH